MEAIETSLALEMFLTQGAAGKEIGRSLKEEFGLYPSHGYKPNLTLAIEHVLH